MLKAIFFHTIKPADAYMGDLPVEFAFATAELRTLCENRLRAVSLLGVDSAKALERILADLQAMPNVAAYQELFSRELQEHINESKAVTLMGGATIVFCCGHVSVPRTRMGQIDWGKVTRIKITELEAANG